MAVIGPHIRGRSHNFAAAWVNIAAAWREMCKALADIGVTSILHQHTGTTVETRGEVYAVLQAVDARYVKFGPDIGQLQKDSSDPARISWGQLRTPAGRTVASLADDPLRAPTVSKWPVT